MPQITELFSFFPLQNFSSRVLILQLCFPAGLAIKNPPAVQERWVWSLSREDPLEEEMATHSSVLTWRIKWTEKPGGLQSMRSQIVRPNWVTRLTHTTVLQILIVWTNQLLNVTFLVRSHLMERYSLSPLPHPNPPATDLCSFLFFLAAPGGMWDLSSPTRDRTPVPCNGSAES